MRYFFLQVSCVILFLAGCISRTNHESSNVLFVSTPEKIKGLDPAYAEDLYSAVEVSQTYEGLFEYHYLKRPYVLVPQLAESMPERSNNGLVYTIRLKKGVVFQDDPCFKSTKGLGRELTSEDVLYSLKRLADPKLASPGWWVLDGRIEGLNTWRDLAAQKGVADYSSIIEGLKAIDRYTVQLKLTRPLSHFLYFLAMPFTFIIPREAVEYYGKDFIQHPVGTGPFRLSEYNPNSKIVWIGNPTYRHEVYPNEGDDQDEKNGLLQDAGASLPFVDRVVVSIFVEQQPMWFNFMSGRLDFSPIPKDHFESAVTSDQELSDELQQKGMRLFKSVSMDLTFASFNMTDPILGKNKYLRQAVSLAYDQVTFNQLFYNGRAIPAKGPIPPGIFGYDSKLKNPYRQFDLTKAKELLKKAGFPEGKGLPPFEYAAIAGTAGRQGAEYFEKIMSSIGIKLKINSYSWPQFLDVIKTKKAQIWEHAWSADYPDAENFFQLFYGQNISPGMNDANYINPEFDRLYEQLALTTNLLERKKLYQKMIEFLIEDCPRIFESHRTNYSVIQPWLKNYKPHAFTHGTYKFYRIDTKLKK